MSHRRDLPNFDPKLVADLQAMAASNNAVFTNKRSAGVLGAPLATISALADGATGEDLVQTVKLWKSSHDQGFQNMRECHAGQAPHSAHASVVQPAQPKTPANPSNRGERRNGEKPMSHHNRNQQTAVFHNGKTFAELKPIELQRLKGENPELYAALKRQNSKEGREIANTARAKEKVAQGKTYLDLSTMERAALHANDPEAFTNLRSAAVKAGQVPA